MLLASDADAENTLNSQISYSILTPGANKAFAIDAASGAIQVLRMLQRRDQQVYNLNIKVSDPGKPCSVSRRVSRFLLLRILTGSASQLSAPNARSSSR